LTLVGIPPVIRDGGWGYFIYYNAQNTQYFYFTAYLVLTDLIKGSTI